MRRDARRKMESSKLWEDKKAIISGSIAIVAIFMLIIATLYARKKSNLIYDGETSPSQIVGVVPEDEISGNTASASSLIGNRVEEQNTSSINESSNNTTTNTTTETNSNVKNTNSAKESANKITNEKKEEQEKSTTNSEKSTSANAQETAKIQKFDWPVKGEILKAFSVDTLLFSTTLQEWTVHNGIDIKADKSAVVCSSADGTIRSIKNDPRYGLTVVIDHADGLKTVYSNLLTAEFVVEGEKVSCGQTIGTVGNTANFEIADDFHLHFEVLKDDNYVDPILYLK